MEKYLTTFLIHPTDTVLYCFITNLFVSNIRVIIIMRISVLRLFPDPSIPSQEFLRGRVGVFTNVIYKTRASLGRV